MKPPARPPRSSSGPLVYILAWTLALTRPVARAAASPILVGDARNTANDTVTVFEDLPEGFHNDIDSITVAVGGHHTCALEYRPGVDFGGPVRCWGSNNWGQSSPSDEIFVQVSAGDKHTCGVKVDQTLSCWGKTRVAPRGLFQQLSVGAHHTCALRREGSAVCWGDNISGSTSKVPKNTTFVQVVAGKDNSCGLRQNGGVDCWGSNSMGQSQPPLDVQFRQIAASNSRHVCGLTVAGAIQCWGRDMRGETQSREGPWQQVTCGQWTTCGIRGADGGIECWGMKKTSPRKNRLVLIPESSFLEESETFVLQRSTSESYPVNTPWCLQAFENNQLNESGTIYEEVSSSEFHTCAVNNEGELECWGNAQQAELVPDGFLAA